MLGCIDGFLHLNLKGYAIDIDLGNLALYLGDFYFVIDAFYFILIRFHLIVCVLMKFWSCRY